MACLFQKFVHERKSVQKAVRGSSPIPVPPPPPRLFSWASEDRASDGSVCTSQVSPCIEFISSNTAGEVKTLCGGETGISFLFGGKMGEM